MRNGKQFTLFISFLIVASCFAAPHRLNMVHAAEPELISRECTTVAFQDLLASHPSISASTFSAAVSAGTSTLPEYCKLTGHIFGFDAFEVMLPPTWNNRFFMAGNHGGYKGIRTPEMFPRVRSGYAAAGVYADNPEPTSTSDGEQWWLDLAGAAVHETAQLARDAIELYYGKQPDYSYFEGCSAGGRQALKEAQEHPEDFDGIIAGNPAMMKLMGSAAYLQPQYSEGSTIPPGKLAYLRDRVYDNCDALDGAEDGIIADPRKCTFDPEKDLRLCPPDTDSADCFTQAQLVALKKIYGGAISNGKHIFPGMPKGAEHFPPSPTSNVEGWGYWLVSNQTPSNSLSVDKESLKYTQHYRLTAELFQVLMTGGTGTAHTYNFLSDWRFNSDDPDTLQRKILEKNISADNANLGPFVASGGKLILYHGWADAASNPLSSSIWYYNEVDKTMREQGKNPDDFLAFYLVPGMGHCKPGVGFSDIDWLGAMIKWVEPVVVDGTETVTPPEELTGTKVVQNIEASRLACRYPEVLTADGSACEPPVLHAYDLRLTMPGTGKGMVTFTDGYQCSGTCRQMYAGGSTVTLNAAASAGSTFDGWTGCDAEDGLTCVVSMPQARSVTASFTRPGTGAVYGTVKDVSGTGLKNALVVLREHDSESCSTPSCRSLATDGTGSYRIGNIVPGSYIGVFSNEGVRLGLNGPWAYPPNQYYNSKQSMATADLIDVSEGSEIKIDVTYPEFGKISGTVTDTTGAFLSNIRISVFDLDEQNVDTGWTDTDGNYTVSHVPSGAYKVKFVANNPGGSVPARNLITQAAFVNMTAPRIISGINATMGPGKSISGRVTDREGLPVPDCAVTVISDVKGTKVSTAKTDAAGAYTAAGIPPGQYKLKFTAAQKSGPLDPAKLYSRVYYGGSADLESAASVTITTDADAAGIDAILEVAGPAIDVSLHKSGNFNVAETGSTTYRSVLITNSGTADLELKALSDTKIGGAFKVDYDRCSWARLAPTKVCTFRVAFSPVSSGTTTDDIVIPSNDPKVPEFTIHLKGIGGDPSGSFYTVAVQSGVTTTVSDTVSVNFESVSGAEPEVTIEVTAAAIPSLNSSVPNFRMLNGASYDIITDAQTYGLVTVCIIYDPAKLYNAENEKNLRLFHFNGISWDDITLLPVDTENNKICGKTDSLSPFGIAEPDAEQLIHSLSTTVNNLSVAQGVRISLTTKLQAAKTAFGARRPAACNLMNAFLREVSAQPRQLSVADADHVRTLASSVMTMLGCE